MKLSADRVDVRERQRARMRSIGQENERAFAVRIDPATGSGKSGMAKSV